MPIPRGEKYADREAAKQERPVASRRNAASVARWSRIRQRLGHCIVLSLLAAAVTGAVFVAGEQRKPLANLSLATAYSSIVLMVLTLAVGPLRVLRGRSSQASNDLRRDAGIGSALLAIVHTLLGLQVHFGGRMNLYFFNPAERIASLPIRYDLFGVANWVGLWAFGLLCFLLSLSNDASIRRLGLKRWKARQRLSYLTVVVVLVHGIVYQQLEGRGTSFVILLLAIFSVAVALQSAGFLASRKKAKAGLVMRGE